MSSSILEQELEDFRSTARGCRVQTIYNGTTEIQKEIIGRSLGV